MRRFTVGLLALVALTFAAAAPAQTPGANAPYTMKGATGPVPASQLDQNWASAHGRRVNFDDYVTAYAPVGELARIRACTSTWDIRTQLSAALGAVAPPVSGTYGGPSGEVDFGDGCYYFGGDYSVQHGATWKGLGGNGRGSFSTQFTFPAFTSMLWLDGNCTDHGTTISPCRDYKSSATGTVIDGISFQGKTSQSSFTGAHPGITLLTVATLRNIMVRNADGSCVEVLNGDGWRADTISLEFCAKYGWFTRGGDSQVGLMTNSHIEGTMLGGVVDTAFLADSYIANDVANSDGNGSPASASNPWISVVNYAGHTFACEDYSACGSTTPTIGSKYTWYDIGPSLYTFPAWVSGYAYYGIAGPYASVAPNGISVFIGDYSEGQVTQPYILPPAVMIGGVQGSGLASVTSFMSSGQYGFQATTGFSAATHNITGPGGATDFIAAVGGAPANGQFWSGELGTGLPWTFGFMLPTDDICLQYGHADSLRGFCVSGTSTTQQFGTGAARPYTSYFSHGLAFAAGGPGRLVTQDSAAPTSGVHAAGEIVLNNAPIGPTSPLGWRASTSGTPGTWDTLPGGGGVTCSGTPTSSFAVTNGLVTHC